MDWTWTNTFTLISNTPPPQKLSSPSGTNIESEETRLCISSRTQVALAWEPEDTMESWVFVTRHIFCTSYPDGSPYVSDLRSIRSNLPNSSIRMTSSQSRGTQYVSRRVPHVPGHCSIQMMTSTSNTIYPSFTVELWNLNPKGLRFVHFTLARVWFSV